MDIDLKRLGHSTLYILGERLSALMPHPMGNSIGLDGLIAFVENKRFEITVTRWVSFVGS